MEDMDNNFNFPVINKGAKCFSSLSPEELSELIKHKSQLHYSKGDILLKQGAFSSGIMFVLDGYVKEFIEGPNSKKTSLRAVGPGDFLALSTLFNSETTPYSIAAITDVTICLFEKEYILHLIKTNSKVGYQLVQRYSAIEQNFFTLLNNQLYKQMHGKVAGSLLYLSDFDNGDLFDSLTRKELAEFSSITAENLIRVLKSFEADGYVELKDKSIRILKPDALRKIYELG